jgi:hypothetical protein
MGPSAIASKGNAFVQRQQSTKADERKHVWEDKDGGRGGRSAEEASSLACRICRPSPSRVHVDMERLFHQLDGTHRSPPPRDLAFRGWPSFSRLDKSQEESAPAKDRPVWEDPGPDKRTPAMLDSQTVSTLGRHAGPKVHRCTPANGPGAVPPMEQSTLAGSSTLLSHHTPPRSGSC